MDAGIPSVIRARTTSSNPTASTGVDRYQTGYMQTPSVSTTQRDSKNDSNLGARREIQRRRRHAPSCMGATELQRNWPEMQKTHGKPGFLSGQDRIRTFRCFPNGFRWFERQSPRNRREHGGSLIISVVAREWWKTLDFRDFKIDHVPTLVDH